MEKVESHRTCAGGPPGRKLVDGQRRDKQVKKNSDGA